MSTCVFLPFNGLTRYFRNYGHGQGSFPGRWGTVPQFLEPPSTFLAFIDCRKFLVTSSSSPTIALPLSMSLINDDSDQESRTASVGSKRRARRGPDGELLSGASTPRKKLKEDRQAQHARNVSNGGRFSSMTSLPPQLSDNQQPGMPVEISDDSASDSSGPTTSHALPAMNWNSGANNVIRTSLQGRNTEIGSGSNAPVPQAPIGFDEHEESSDDASVESNDNDEDSEDENDEQEEQDLMSERHLETPDKETVSISDDSDIGSGDDSGIMLNVESRNEKSPDRASSQISDDDHGGSESGEIESSDDQAKQTKVSTTEQARNHGESQSYIPDAYEADGQYAAQLDGPTESRQKGQKLGDLGSQDLEDQIKYAYFHLHRDQLDLGKPVICLTCLEEGHMAGSCPSRQVCHFLLSGGLRLTTDSVNIVVSRTSIKVDSALDTEDV